MPGRPAWPLPFFLLVLFLIPCEAAAGAEANPAELRDLLARRKDELRIQTDFPSERRETNASGYAPHSGGGGSVVSPGAASSMMWGALVVFALVLLLTLYDTMRSRSGPKGERRRAASDEAERIGERMDSVRQEGDALAAAGDYAGAMHVLLLQSVDEMRRRLGVAIAASLTSREILHRTRLEPRAHAFLGDIVNRVEISWFGTHLPGPDDYARCRDSFVGLTDILRRGGAA